MGQLIAGSNPVSSASVFYDGQPCTLFGSIVFMVRSLPIFIVAVVLTGWTIGILNVPDGWYAGLAKPAFNPPSWVFGPVWTLLYVLIALAGWRTWMREGGGGKAFRLWLVQMGLNFAWSPVFFGLHMPAAAFIILLLLLAAIGIFIADRHRLDRTSALLFLPYAAWVTFAGVLNLSILLLNPLV